MMILYIRLSKSEVFYLGCSPEGHGRRDDWGPSVNSTEGPP
jgi:hypothetical protein